ncbi:MAG: SDR family oxidoreductase [Actinomycetota bacterium]|nr:SDR family oxidoreductase [Actinomycetota bacterium]
MRVFVTGGTGFIGAAVVRDLSEAGHTVLGLARSAASVALLQAAGAKPHQGSLEDLDGLRAAAAHSDAVIHTAFDNSNLVRFRKNSRVERSALQAIGDVLAGSDRPIVAAGGFAPVLAAGPVFTELDPASPNAGPLGRNVERTMMTLADRGVNASIVRLPCVHGDGDHFTIPRFIDIARKKRKSGYFGDGRNRLPAVHNIDAARVFRLAIERGVAASRYHAVAEEGVPYKDIAEIIARHLSVPAVSLSPLKGRMNFGLYTAYVKGDGPASSALTREQLGWAPQGPTLLADIDRPAYFKT